MKSKILVLAAALAMTCGVLSADDNPRVVKLTVSAAAPPTPPLRYRFTPAARQLSDGNAAALYYRGIVLLEQYGRTRADAHQSMVKISDWLELPLEELPRDEARRLLSSYESLLAEVRLGALRKQAEWDLPLREQGVNTLLPEIQQIRHFGRLLALQARLAILEGDYATASRELETMFTMCRHLGGAGTVVSMLVGLAIESMAAEEIEHWIAQPDSPNTYWALTSLPVHSVDVRAAIESEDLWIQGSLPYSDLLGRSILTPGQLDELARQVGSLIESSAIGTSITLGLNSGETVQFAVPSQLAILPTILRVYPAAKRQLIEAGGAAADIEALSPTQVVMLRAIQIYRELLDESVIWAGHPYGESRLALEEVADRLDSLKDSPEAFLASLMLPATNFVGRAVFRDEQLIAMLRVIEALRLFAAAHEGRLPANLSEISEVPVPFDPVVDRPFQYRLDGDTAILSAAEQGIVMPDTQFEITVRR